MEIRPLCTDVRREPVKPALVCYIFQVISWQMLTRQFSPLAVLIYRFFPLSVTYSNLSNISILKYHEPYFHQQQNEQLTHWFYTFWRKYVFIFNYTLLWNVLCNLVWILIIWCLMGQTKRNIHEQAYITITAH